MRGKVDGLQTNPEVGTEPMNRSNYRPHFEWQLRTRKLALGQRTLLMAIVNLTPDSFSGDGLLSAGGTVGLRPPAAVIKLAVGMAIEAVDAGADIVDLGAESTRPNATPITSEQEQARLLPVLEQLLRERPDAVVSVDTYHADTARAAGRAGAEIINDVSGLTWDPSMAKAVSQSGCGLVLMHARGRSGEWQTLPGLDGDAVMPVVFAGLCEQLAQAEAAGIRTERIVADPGFGFGKRGAENFALLARLGRLRELGRPLLVGLSRKGFLGDAVKRLQRRKAEPAEARRIATAAANVAAILAGAHVLRVHDLQVAQEAAAIADAVLSAANQD
ncbi:dihydropteroate synthase [Granulicella sp. L46]|uniref:dihydropteroate synthase n=1 Tax=Granulicella sp. L46 TaxID=1641865 RepID=UPI0020B16B84|nr:dihydropteroate synthase [Granulicella sp. L46]